MFAHLGGMLRLCCHILASCWTMLWAMLDRRGPPEVILGYVVFMTSPSFPKFCLKKLSPVACEAATSFLQHHFSEKAESCWGRAHPSWAPEGSHQWPARFQETLPEGRKRGSAAPGGCPGSWSYDSGYHIASAARHGRIFIVASRRRRPPSSRRSSHTQHHTPNITHLISHTQFLLLLCLRVLVQKTCLFVALSSKDWQMSPEWMICSVSHQQEFATFNTSSSESNTKLFLMSDECLRHDIEVPISILQKKCLLPCVGGCLPSSPSAGSSQPHRPPRHHRRSLCG